MIILILQKRKLRLREGDRWSKAGSLRIGRSSDLRQFWLSPKPELFLKTVCLPKRILIRLKVLPVLKVSCEF